MSFANPTLAWLVLAAPIVYFALQRVARFHDQATHEFAGVRARPRGEREGKPWRGCAVFVLLALAAGGPLIGTEDREVEHSGLDVVVALDVSRSMWVEDVGESRIDRARREIVEFTTALGAGRVGLIAFSGAAERMCPLTDDRIGLRSRLDDANPTARAGAGSSLIVAIDAALAELGDDETRERAVLLVSDGETRDDTLAWTECIARTLRAGVVVYAIVVGTADGGPVPEGGGRNDRFVAGEDGPVVSRADRTRMTQIVTATGGVLVANGANPGDMTDAARSLGGATTEDGGRTKSVPSDRYRWLVGLSLVLLIPWPRSRDHARALVAPARVLGLIASPFLLAFALEDAWRDGVAAYERGEYAEAIERYQAALATASGESKRAIEFDLALALLRVGEPTLAGAQFERLAELFEGRRGTSALGAGIAAVREAEAARGTPRELARWKAAKAHFVAALRNGVGDVGAANLEYVTRRVLELESAAGTSAGGEPNPAEDPNRGEDGSEPPRDPNRPNDPTSGDAQDPPPATGGDERTEPRDGEGEGPIEGVAPDAPPPLEAARRLRHAEIDAIVREFERRRITYDRAQSARSRGAEPFDW